MPQVGPPGQAVVVVVEEPGPVSRGGSRGPRGQPAHPLAAVTTTMHHSHSHLGRRVCSRVVVMFMEKAP